MDDSTTPKHPDFSLSCEHGLRVEHVFLKEKKTLGEKRNLSHSLCKANTIVIFDDDDYYPPSRISHALQALDNSGKEIAGSSLLPIVLLPEKQFWLAGPYGANHGTFNTLAFRKSYLKKHRCDPAKSFAEEAFFLDDFQTPMAQLDPVQTVFCIGHSGNTVNKHNFVERNKGKRLHPFSHTPDKKLEEYIREIG